MPILFTHNSSLRYDAGMTSYAHENPLGNGRLERGEKSDRLSAETTPGKRDPINWVVVQKTMGLIPAQIMADRLIVEGIPARASQEGGGVFGLTVGILGEGRVHVPKEREDEARELLDALAQEPIEWEEE